MLSACRAEIEAAFRALSDCYASGGKLLVCGNGGSAADADHIVGELMKGYLKPRPSARTCAPGCEPPIPRWGRRWPRTSRAPFPRST